MTVINLNIQEVYLLFKWFKDEIQGIKDRDPAARNALEVLLCYRLSCYYLL